MNINEKLGTAFHESFTLNRSRLAQILQVAKLHSSERKPTFDDYRTHTLLGRNQVKSFRRYAQGAGLLQKDEKLSSFGEAVCDKDSTLSNSATLWTIHYFLSAPHCGGPLFWNYLASNLWAEQEEISREKTSERVKTFLQTRDDAELAEDTYNVAASVFLNSYIDNEGLGQLEILEKEGDFYRVREPKPIPAGAFACILADYWENVWGAREEMLLREVNEGELARLLLLSSGQVNDLLGALSDRGLLTRQRRVPPFKITRGWGDSAALWESVLYS